MTVNTNHKIYIGLSQGQMDLMRKALGLDFSNRPVSREIEVAEGTQFKSCADELVSKGLMVPKEYGVYRVTEKALDVFQVAN